MQTTLTTALQRIDLLGSISDSPDYLDRSFLSPANQKAATLILGWMDALGMQTAQAPDGTVRGILSGSQPSATPLLIGSHYDTVIGAGKYDGPLGIILALAAIENLQLAGISLPFPIHMLAFSDEEGTRFQTTYLGSRSIIADLDQTTLNTCDAAGISVAEAIATESPTASAPAIRYRAGECRGYVELHIEQGRVLEEISQPACVVSTIVGQSRLKITLTGRSDHAGTTPMPLRRDALCGAAACILAAESLAKSYSSLFITVGKIQIHPGASNSIPQTATFTIDLRHPDDTARLRALEQLHKRFSNICHERDLALDWQSIQENDAVPCDVNLTDQLIHSLAEITQSRLTLQSGAGHDGVVISKICPIAMLFIRNRDGLSHHPDEFVTSEDVGIGIEILTHFLSEQAR